VGTDIRLVAGGLAGADVVVESSAPEAAALAALLTSEGARVRLATPAQLDAEPFADVSFLDAWTPEVAPRVVALRAAGARVTCLADLLLARAPGAVLAVTGTAGKTTTTALLARILHAAAIDVVVPEPGVAGNLWPDATLLAALARTPPPALLLMELTSSHLAFCSASPTIAVVTSLWPDHVELHGSVDAYAHAKETIARDQDSDGWLVVPDNGSCERFVASSRAEVARFSLEREVERGAFVRGGVLTVRWDGRESAAGLADALPLRGRCLAAALAACAAARAAGASPQALVDGLAGAEVPSHRLLEVARIGDVPVFDDGMAATPAKAAAALETWHDRSVVLVAGGEDSLATGRVHAAPEERALLGSACGLAARKARRIVLFGPAAARLAPLVPAAEIVETLAEAVARAIELAPGSAAVLVAPMFPLAHEERARIPELARIRRR
jgi:UDP-N-acetylmuramoylalanine--D-glutamate ligase